MAEEISIREDRVRGNFPSSHWAWLVLGQIVSAAGILIFWAHFFFFENGRSSELKIWLAYERAFPVADVFWLVPLLILSAVWLSKMNIKGIVTTIAYGGGLVFLGFVDAAFNIQQGVYARSLADALLNGSLNLFCILFGFSSILAGWLLMKGILEKESPEFRA